MGHRHLRIICWLSLLVIVSLACGLTDTAERLQEGAQAVETIQGIVTQIDETGIRETVQAVGTDFGESGIPETAQAVTTELAEKGFQETAQAFATDIVIQPGEVPPDIPIMEGEKSAFVGQENTITYTIDEEFKHVLDFYQSEMPARGWTKVEGASVISDRFASLQFTKSGQRVDVILTAIPILEQVTVLITMQ